MASNPVSIAFSQIFGRGPSRTVTPPVQDEIKKASISGGQPAHWPANRWGGYSNSTTGSGTIGDKLRGATVMPTRITYPDILEIMSVELWQLRRFIEVIAEDMTSNWREFESAADPDSVRVMMDQEKKFRIKQTFRSLIEQGRKYGTAVGVIVTNDAPLDMPLDVDRIRPGDLKNILVLDRFQLNVEQTIEDIYDLDCGMPLMYRWNSSKYGNKLIHHSRILRYDGVNLPTRYGHSSTSYDDDWGISVIVSVIIEVFRDEDIEASITAQLLRSRTLSLHLPDFAKLIDAGYEATGGKKRAKTLQQVLEEFEQGVRSHRMVAMSEEAKLGFVSPALSGLGQLIETRRDRLAGAFDIPVTRLWGIPPKGLNASAKDDMEQYASMIKSRQESKLTPLTDKLDLVLGLDGGLYLHQIPQSSWVPYLKANALQDVEIAERKVNLVVKLRERDLADDDECRSILDGDTIIGHLEPWEGESPFTEEQDEMVPDETNDDNDEDEPEE